MVKFGKRIAYTKSYGKGMRSMEKGKKKKICEMSKIYNCTASAVRESVMSIRNLLMRMPNEKIEMLQKIMEE